MQASEISINLHIRRSCCKSIWHLGLIHLDLRWIFIGISQISFPVRCPLIFLCTAVHLRRAGIVSGQERYRSARNSTIHSHASVLRRDITVGLLLFRHILFLLFRGLRRYKSRNHLKCLFSCRSRRNIQRGRLNRIIYLDHNTFSKICNLIRFACFQDFDRSISVSCFCIFTIPIFIFVDGYHFLADNFRISYYTDSIRCIYRKCNAV